MQIEKTSVRKALNRKEQAIIDTLQLTSEICTQRHFSGLFKKMREFMPKYFGFQGCGVLLYDKEREWFFTEPGFTLGDDQPEEPNQKQSSKPAGNYDSSDEEDIDNQLNQKNDQKTDEMPLTAKALAEEIKAL